MMETRLIPKKFLRLIKNLADENRNYKKIFGNVFWLEVVKKKNYNWFNLRLNSIVDCPELPEIAYVCKVCRLSTYAELPFAILTEMTKISKILPFVYTKSSQIVVKI